MSDRLLKESDVMRIAFQLPYVVNSAFFDAVKALPSADRPRGEWIPCTKSGLILTELMRREGQKWYGYKCSECNRIHKGNA